MSSSVPTTRFPRLLLRRETLRRYVGAAESAPADSMASRVSTIVHHGVVAYPDPLDLSRIDDELLPVLQAMQGRRENLMLGILTNSTNFLVRRFAFTVERVRDAGIATIMELRGSWIMPTLGLISEVRPAYLRIGPDSVRGIGHLPELFREVAAVAEFARDYGIPLIARGCDSDSDLDALQVAGVDLMQTGVTAGDLDQMLFASHASRGPSFRVRDLSEPAASPWGE
ncbi:MAG: hypothetical protein U0132_18095 [Gemmatimonadaceae bacterium]